ncbi:MAG: hypothetical protein AVDCRST_MAG70-2333, partial [uncultured Thermomicrobiales bacterium]
DASVGRSDVELQHTSPCRDVDGWRRAGRRGDRTLSEQSIQRDPSLRRHEDVAV